MPACSPPAPACPVLTQHAFLCNQPLFLSFLFFPHVSPSPHPVPAPPPTLLLPCCTPLPHPGPAAVPAAVPSKGGQKVDPSVSLVPDPASIPSASEFKKANNFGLVTMW